MMTIATSYPFLNILWDILIFSEAPWMIVGDSRA